MARNKKNRTIGDNRICSLCKTLKPLPDFSKCPQGYMGYGYWCKLCKMARYKQTYPIRSRQVDPETYKALREQADNSCAICGATDGTKALCVDHDHATGQVRGILCSLCNLALGYFKDSPELLEIARSYLESSRMNPTGIFVKSQKGQRPKASN